MTAAGGTRRVVVLQRIVPHYRCAFFDRLASRLARERIDLTVVAGQPRPGEGFDDCRDAVACVRTAPNRYLPGGLYLQAAGPHLRGADLIVLEHASAPLLNHLVLTRRASLGRPPQLAFWGHGADLNRPARASSVSAWLKRGTARLADHWFAYTALSRSLLLGMGVPDARITVVNNSHDVAGAVTARDLPAPERARLRAAHGLGPGPLAVFCSRLYPGKRLDFLLDAVALARASAPELRLLVVGDGELAPWLAARAASEPWLVPVGARYGAEKQRLLAAADFMVMPAWIGLSVLDAFAAGLPVVTVAGNRHSPEIAYLEDGHNARITAPAVSDYAAALVDVATRPDLAARLAAGATTSASAYSLDEMCERFAEGVERCVNHRLSAAGKKGSACSAMSQVHGQLS
ncbi:MAG: glycosyltransferase family 4 protein [Geminicoccaceae bacterium]